MANPLGLFDSFLRFESAHPATHYASIAKGWLPVAYISAAIYLVVIGWLSRVMRKRQAMELKHALAVWNFALALFSIVAVIRLTPDVFSVRPGLYLAFCDRGISFDNKNVAAFWLFAFMLSKIAEFGDTLFLVLRKRPISFLHCYHHVTVEIYVWSSIASLAPAGPWFCWINVCVHSLMYSYYFLRAINIRVPLFISKSITRIQIVQMFVGMLISTYTAIVQLLGYSCDHTYGQTLLSFCLYFGYFVLFGKFYVQTYSRSRKTHSYNTLNNNSNYHDNCNENGVSSEVKKLL